MRDLDPARLAEALLLALDRGQLAAVDVTPAPGGHQVRGERGGRGLLLGVLPAEAGDALAARLALLAGLDPAASDEQLGRLKTRRPGGSAVDHRVTLRPAPDGRSIVVRTVLADAATPVSDDANRSIGTYTFGDELGRGGMGIVYRGEHATLQKPVAIKVLHHGASERLVREARAACRARHPGIVDVSDIGRLADGRTFLVMELLEAPTLDVVLREGPLAVDRVLRVAAQVASALGAAFQAGVVHRDIKPANLFLLPGDRVKVGDFGVAALDETAEGMAGTAWYMAPELSQGRPADVRSDLYSLGIVMFEMLTGRVPFDGDRPAEILAAHLSSPVSPMVGPTGLVAEEVQAVVRRALEKDPDDRFQTPAEMQAAIEQVAR